MLVSAQNLWPPFQDPTKGPFVLTWTVLDMSAPARVGWMGMWSFCSAYGFMNVADVRFGIYVLPFAARLDAWSVSQGNTNPGYLNGVTLTLTRTADTVVIDTFVHVPNTSMQRPLALNVAANETFSVRHNDPGQGTQPRVGMQAFLMGHRL